MVVRERTQQAVGSDRDVAEALQTARQGSAELPSLSRTAYQRLLFGERGGEDVAHLAARDLRAEIAGEKFWRIVERPFAGIGKAIRHARNRGESEDYLRILDEQAQERMDQRVDGFRKMARSVASSMRPVTILPRIGQDMAGMHSYSAAAQEKWAARNFVFMMEHGRAAEMTHIPDAGVLIERAVAQRVGQGMTAEAARAQIKQELRDSALEAKRTAAFGSKRRAMREAIVDALGEYVNEDETRALADIRELTRGASNYPELSKDERRAAREKYGRGALQAWDSAVETIRTPDATPVPAALGTVIMDRFTRPLAQEFSGAGGPEDQARLIDARVRDGIGPEQLVQLQDELRLAAEGDDQVRDYLRSHAITAETLQHHIVERARRMALDAQANGETVESQGRDIENIFASALSDLDRTAAVQEFSRQWSGSTLGTIAALRSGDERQIELAKNRMKSATVEVGTWAARNAMYGAIPASLVFGPGVGYGLVLVGSLAGRAYRSRQASAETVRIAEARTARGEIKTVDEFRNRKGKISLLTLMNKEYHIARLQEEGNEGGKHTTVGGVLKKESNIGAMGHQLGYSDILGGADREGLTADEAAAILGRYEARQLAATVSGDKIGGRIFLGEDDRMSRKQAEALVRRLRILAGEDYSENGAYQTARAGETGVMTAALAVDMDANRRFTEQQATRAVLTSLVLRGAFAEGAGLLHNIIVEHDWPSSVSDIPGFLERGFLGSSMAKSLEHIPSDLHGYLNNADLLGQRLESLLNGTQEEVAGFVGRQLTGLEYHALAQLEFIHLLGQPTHAERFLGDSGYSLDYVQHLQGLNASGLNPQDLNLFPGTPIDLQADHLENAILHLAAGGNPHDVSGISEQQLALFGQMRVQVADAGIVRPELLNDPNYLQFVSGMDRFQEAVNVGTIPVNHELDVNGFVGIVGFPQSAGVNDAFPYLNLGATGFDADTLSAHGLQADALAHHSTALTTQGTPISVDAWDASHGVDAGSHLQFVDNPGFAGNNQELHMGFDSSGHLYLYDGFKPEGSVTQGMLNSDKVVVAWVQDSHGVMHEIGIIPGKDGHVSLYPGDQDTYQTVDLTTGKINGAITGDQLAQRAGITQDWINAYTAAASARDAAHPDWTNFSTDIDGVPPLDIRFGSGVMIVDASGHYDHTAILASFHNADLSHHPADIQVSQATGGPTPTGLPTTPTGTPIVSGTTFYVDGQDVSVGTPDAQGYIPLVKYDPWDTAHAYPHTIGFLHQDATDPSKFDVYTVKSGTGVPATVTTPAIPAAPDTTTVAGTIPITADAHQIDLNSAVTSLHSTTGVADTATTNPQLASFTPYQSSVLQVSHDSNGALFFDNRLNVQIDNQTDLSHIQTTLTDLGYKDAALEVDVNGQHMFFVMQSDGTFVDSNGYVHVLTDHGMVLMKADEAAQYMQGQNMQLVGVNYDATTGDISHFGVLGGAHDAATTGTPVTNVNVNAAEIDDSVRTALGVAKLHPNIISVTSNGQTAYYDLGPGETYDSTANTLTITLAGKPTVVSIAGFNNGVLDVVDSSGIHHQITGVVTEGTGSNAAINLSSSTTETQLAASTPPAGFENIHVDPTGTTHLVAVVTGNQTTVNVVDSSGATINTNPVTLSGGVIQFDTAHGTVNIAATGTVKIPDPTSMQYVAINTGSGDMQMTGNPGDYATYNNGSFTLYHSDGTEFGTGATMKGQVLEYTDALSKHKVDVPLKANALDFASAQYSAVVSPKGSVIPLGGGQYAVYTNAAHTSFNIFDSKGHLVGTSAHFDPKNSDQIDFTTADKSHAAATISVKAGTAVKTDDITNAIGNAENPHSAGRNLEATGIGLGGLALGLGGTAAVVGGIATVRHARANSVSVRSRAALGAGGTAIATPARAVWVSTPANVVLGSSGQQRIITGVGTGVGLVGGILLGATPLGLAALLLALPGYGIGRFIASRRP